MAETSLTQYQLSITIYKKSRRQRQTTIKNESHNSHINNSVTCTQIITHVLNSHQNMVNQQYEWSNNHEHEHTHVNKLFKHDKLSSNIKHMFRTSNTIYKSLAYVWYISKTLNTTSTHGCRINNTYKCHWQMIGQLLSNDCNIKKCTNHIFCSLKYVHQIIKIWNTIAKHGYQINKI